MRTSSRPVLLIWRRLSRRRLVRPIPPRLSPRLPPPLRGSYLRFAVFATTAMWGNYREVRRANSGGQNLR